VASIGSETVDEILQGRVPTLGEETELWRIPGHDSYGARKVGQGEAEFSLTTQRILTTENNADAHYTNSQALRATVVTVTDQDGDTHANCLVLGVARIRQQEVNDGAGVKFRVILQWNLVRIGS